MIRRCDQHDMETIWAIINDGATAYRGAIPEDCWHEPYMSRDELAAEIGDGVEFWAEEQDGHVRGVMGLQPVRDVALIRHAYVRTEFQRLGVGARLLSHLRAKTDAPILIGTWAAATWAIAFYEKHGFRMVDEATKVHLLGEYWKVPPRQVETSVVLIDR